MTGVLATFMGEVASSFQKLVQPSLIAIYASHHNREDVPVQVGTGFLIEHKSRPVLVTAKHVLRGQSFNEDPAEKAFHANGGWVYVGDGSRDLYEPAGQDVALYYADELSAKLCLAPGAISTTDDTPRIITIGGYLARDFKRQNGVLRPKPWIYSNVATAVSGGLIALRYPKRRNVSSQSGQATVNPTPRGKSGGPMLDTIALMRGEVRVVGVFTEQSNGTGRGESVAVIRATLAKLV